MANVKDFFSQVVSDTGDVHFDTDPEPTEEEVEGEGEETSTPPTGDNDTDTDLLRTSDDDDADESDDAAAALGEEGEGDNDDPEADPLVDEKPEKRPVQKRIDKLVAERNDARDGIVERDKKIVELETRQETLTELYGKFDNPAYQLKYDAGFMNHLEKLVEQEDPKAQEVAARIHQLLEKEGLSMTRNHSTPQASDAPAERSEVEVALAQKAARSVIDSALPENVHSLFKRSFTRDIIMSLDAEDLVALEKEDVLDLARRYIQSEGLAKTDVYKDAAAKSETPTTSPANKAGSPRSAGRAKQDSSNDQDSEERVPAREKYKNFSHYQKHKDKLISSLVQD